MVDIRYIIILFIILSITLIILLYKALKRKLDRSTSESVSHNFGSEFTKIQIEPSLYTNIPAKKTKLVAPNVNGICWRDRNSIRCTNGIDATKLDPLIQKNIKWLASCNSNTVDSSYTQLKDACQEPGSRYPFTANIQGNDPPKNPGCYLHINPDKNLVGAYPSKEIQTCMGQVPYEQCMMDTFQPIANSECFPTNCYVTHLSSTNNQYKIYDHDKSVWTSDDHNKGPRHVYANPNSDPTKCKKVQVNNLNDFCSIRQNTGKFVAVNYVDSDYPACNPKLGNYNKGDDYDTKIWIPKPELVIDPADCYPEPDFPRCYKFKPKRICIQKDPVIGAVCTKHGDKPSQTCPKIQVDLLDYCRDQVKDDKGKVIKFDLLRDNSNPACPNRINFLNKCYKNKIDFKKCYNNKKCKKLSDMKNPISQEDYCMIDKDNPGCIGDTQDIYIPDEIYNESCIIRDFNDGMTTSDNSKKITNIADYCDLIDPKNPFCTDKKSDYVLVPQTDIYYPGHDIYNPGNPIDWDPVKDKGSNPPSTDKCIQKTLDYKIKYLCHPATKSTLDPNNPICDMTKRYTDNQSYDNWCDGDSDTSFCRHRQYSNNSATIWVPTEDSPDTSKCVPKKVNSIKDYCKKIANYIGYKGTSNTLFPTYAEGSSITSGPNPTDYKYPTPTQYDNLYTECYQAYKWDDNTYENMGLDSPQATVYEPKVPISMQECNIGYPYFKPRMDPSKPITDSYNKNIISKINNTKFPQNYGKDYNYNDHCYPNTPNFTFDKDNGWISTTNSDCTQSEYSGLSNNKGDIKSVYLHCRNIDKSHPYCDRYLDSDLKPKTDKDINISEIDGKPIMVPKPDEFLNFNNPDPDRCQQYKLLSSTGIIKPDGSTTPGFSLFDKYCSPTDVLPLQPGQLDPICYVNFPTKAGDSIEGRNIKHYTDIDTTVGDIYTYIPSPGGDKSPQLACIKSNCGVQQAPYYGCVGDIDSDPNATSDDLICNKWASNISRCYTQGTFDNPYIISQNDPSGLPRGLPSYHCSRDLDYSYTTDHPPTDKSKWLSSKVVLDPSLPTFASDESKFYEACTETLQKYPSSVKILGLRTGHSDTDFGKCLIDSKGLPTQREPCNYHPDNISGFYSMDGSIDANFPISSLEQDDKKLYSIDKWGVNNSSISESHCYDIIDDNDKKVTNKECIAGSTNYPDFINYCNDNNKLYPQYQNPLCTDTGPNKDYYYLITDSNKQDNPGSTCTKKDPKNVINTDIKYRTCPSNCPVQDTVNHQCINKYPTPPSYYIPTTSGDDLDLCKNRANVLNKRYCEDGACFEQVFAKGWKRGSTTTIPRGEVGWGAQYSFRCRDPISNLTSDVKSIGDIITLPHYVFDKTWDSENSCHTEVSQNKQCLKSSCVQDSNNKWISNCTMGQEEIPQLYVSKNNEGIPICADGTVLEILKSRNSGQSSVLFPRSQYTESGMEPTSNNQYIGKDNFFIDTDTADCYCYNNPNDPIGINTNPNNNQCYDYTKYIKSDTPTLPAPILIGNVIKLIGDNDQNMFSTGTSLTDTNCYVLNTTRAHNIYIGNKDNHDTPTYFRIETDSPLDFGQPLMTNEGFKLRTAYNDGTSNVWLYLGYCYSNDSINLYGYDSIQDMLDSDLFKWKINLNTQYAIITMPIEDNTQYTIVNSFNPSIKLQIDKTNKWKMIKV